MISFLGPNIFLKDVLASLRRPKKDGSSIKKLENYFAKKFGHAFSFNAGRSAMLAILKALNLKSDDEVLVQAYSCVAVPDSVLWAGARVVYVDIDENTFNMDPKDLVKKISQHSKVVVVQHTFGIPAKMDEILQIAQKHHLFVIEDCAHGGPGNLGDAGFFSFGRDKMISSVFGGMAVTRNKSLAEKLKKFQKRLEYPSYPWIIKQLLYNPITFLVNITYDFLIGKLMHYAVTKLGLVYKELEPMEKSGGKPKFYPKKMPASLASLASLQLKRLAGFNQKRQRFAKAYQEELMSFPIRHPSLGSPLLRYTIQLENPRQLQEFALKRGIVLGNWYDNVVAPKDVDLKAIGYEKGSCSVAEKVAQHSLNLPTSPNLKIKDVKKVIKAVKDFYAQN